MCIPGDDLTLLFQLYFLLYFLTSATFLLHFLLYFFDELYFFFYFLLYFFEASTLLYSTFLRRLLYFFLLYFFLLRLLGFVGLPECTFRVSIECAHHELASLAARFARQCLHNNVPEWSFREGASEESAGMCIPGDDWRLRPIGACGR